MGALGGVWKGCPAGPRGGRAAPENRERRTENGAPGKRAMGEAAGRVWAVCPAGLTRRARRTTKAHEGLPVYFHPQRTQRVTKDTKDEAGAGRACAQGARPARGACRAWRASHAMLWGRGRGGRAAPENRERKTERAAPKAQTFHGYRTPDKRATDKATCKGNQASKPLNFQASNHPCTRRHVCDVPRDDATGDSGDAGGAGGAAEPPRRTENGERSVQRRRRKPSTATERPCGRRRRAGIWGGAPPRKPSL